MINFGRIALVFFVYFLAVEVGQVKTEPNNPPQTAPSVKAYVITCKGLIDNGLKESIKRRTEFALQQGAKYLIYEIQTYGGLVKSADEISSYLLDTSKKARTVAFITSKAISAGAMVSVSCQDILMRKTATIGAAAPILMGGQLEGIEREKTESFIRGIFEAAAEANHYPKPLLRAMVTVRIEVYRIKNKKSGEYEFFEGDNLPTAPNVYDLEHKELIDSDKELLTLTASRALEYGLARAVVENIEQVLDFLANRDGVNIVRPATVLKTNWSEKMVRCLNHPAVMSILVMLALLGVYLELSTPGVGLPGLVAVICFSIIIGSKYLVGLANWVEIAIFILGVLLLLIEFLVLPGFGLAGVLGIICILFGLFGMLLRNPPDRLPWPQTELDWQLFVYDALGMGLGVVGFAFMAVVFARYMPKMRFLSGLILIPTPPKTGDEFEVSMTAPANAEVKSLKVGEVGEVVAKLRPAGKVRFGDFIVDCLAQAEFIEEGAKVQISKIRGNKVVVRRLGGEDKE